MNQGDFFGLAIWLEGPSCNEPYGHQSVNVGDPNGTYDSYSYGMNGNGFEGVVYKDTEHGGPIEAYKKTTPAVDAYFKKQMENKIGDQTIYGWNDICRSWSQRQYNSFPGTPAPAPARTPSPHTKVGPSSSHSSTRTSSTTGTWTSK